MQSQKNIVLAVGAGAATFKAVEVASTLTKEGHNVHVLMSPDATRFVGPLSFAAVTGKAAQTSMFPDNPGTREELFPHLYPTSQADAFVVVPATADILAKLASGMADNVVTGAALATTDSCVRIFCPAMNTNMWKQSPVQENVKTLLSRGWLQVGPEDGHLACGSKGPGRMVGAQTIVEAINAHLAGGKKLKDKRVLIFSGPTREYLDPVRYLSNGSSGLMGKSLALEALRLGAGVDFVSGPVDATMLPDSSAAAIHKITSAAEMLAVGKKLFPHADIIIFAAAVSDYGPKKQNREKIKKSKAKLNLDLEPTPDIAATLGKAKKSGQFTLGFALESENGLKNASAKLRAKNLDAIVLNGPESMANTKASFNYLCADKADSPEKWGKIEKSLCAAKIFERITGNI